VIVGGSGSFSGTDTADRVTNRSTMTGDVLLGDGDDVLDGRGGLFNGQFFGGNGNDRMDLRGAGPVPDTIFGDSGVDTILGTDGGDTIQGEGSDVPFGKVGIDLLLGGNGDDALDGGTGRDTLLGGSGDDTFAGGAGGDLMTGGQGRDTFLCVAATHIGTLAGNRDRIADFTARADLIDLTVVDANSNVASDQAFAFVGAAAFSNLAGQLRYLVVDRLLQGDTNGDGVADFSQELASLPALPVTDILLQRVGGTWSEIPDTCLRLRAG